MEVSIIMSKFSRIAAFRQKKRIYKILLENFVNSKVNRD